MTLPLTHSMLEHLLQRRNAYPTGATAIDAHIRANFVQRYAVLVLDMSGFSRMSIEYGIIHFLAMIQRLVDIVTPIIESDRGRVFKQEADNLYAVFPTVQQAIDAAINLLDELAIANQTTPADHALHASIGIGYGDVIVVSDDSGLRDVFGNEMNMASKLGEDLAEPGEILLTKAAYEQLPQPRYTSNPRTVILSQVNLVAYTVSRPVGMQA